MLSIEEDSLKTVGRFRNIRDLVHEDEVISSDKFLSLTEKHESLLYWKRDFLFKRGVWRGKQYPSLMNFPDSLVGKKLILGHSDRPTSALLSKVVFATKKVVKIFGTNIEPISQLSFSLPLGVTNFTEESKLHLLLGDVTHFLNADDRSGFEEDFSLSIYAGFTAKNNRRVRGEVLRVLSSLPSQFKVSVDLPEFSPGGRIKFLENTRRSSFTVCPEGNGVDTHRLWETLYMGGVPIVTPNPLMDSLYAQLPVLVIKKWSDLSDHKLLEEKWHEVCRTSWNSSLLRQSYWDSFVSR